MCIFVLQQYGGGGGGRERARVGKTERDLTVFYSKSMFEYVLCLFYS